MNKKLVFCFKGQRTYVQGPDIVSALFKAFSHVDLTKIDLKFSGVVSTNLELVEGFDRADAKVNISWFESGQEKEYRLIDSGEPIQCRYGYDEGEILNQTVLNISENSIKLISETGYTLCENFVAMNKFLLQSLFPEEKGKWYFTRLEQSKVILDDTLIEVKLVKNFKFRLTKSDIFSGGDLIGSVYFTMVRD